MYVENSSTTKEQRTYNEGQSTQSVVWENWTAICKRTELDHHLAVYKNSAQIGLKTWMLTLETIKLLQERCRWWISWHLSWWFFDVTPKAIKAKINKGDYIKLKIFSKAKEIISKMKGQTTTWEKVFANHIYDEVNVQNTKRTQTTQHQRTIQF